MRLTQQLALFALASTIAAVPHRFHQKQQDNLPPGCSRQGRNVVVCTKTVTAGQPAPTNAPAPVNNPAPAPAPAPQPEPEPEPEPQPQPTPVAAAAAPNGNAAGASGGQGNYMATVAKFRAAGGLAALEQDSQLEGNARKTAADGKGEMVHQLLPGTFGQVLQQGGDENNFEQVYVESWLCEIPSLPGIGGLCDTDVNSDETGHAEILTDPKYKKIGCAFVRGGSKNVGIWACDLA